MLFGTTIYINKQRRLTGKNTTDLEQCSNCEIETLYCLIIEIE